MTIPLMIEAGRTEIEDRSRNKGAFEGEGRRSSLGNASAFLPDLAPFSLMPLLEEVLGGSLPDQENLNRWVNANTQLLEGGQYR